jgi:hypothetical protein
MAPAAAADTSLKIVVDPAVFDMPELLAAAGARLVVDRGTYSIYEISSEILPTETHAGLTPRRDFDALSLRRGVVSTHGGPAGGAGMLPDTGRERRLKLIQLAAPPTTRSSR